MKKIFISTVFVAVILGYWYLSGKDSLYMLPKIDTRLEVRNLFPTTPVEIVSRIDDALEIAKRGIEKIISLKPEERTFTNTILALDRVSANVGIVISSIHTLQSVSPDEIIRKACQAPIIKAQNFFVDYFSNNRALYRAVKEYDQGPGKNEQLNAEEQKYLTETIKDFEKAGLGLPDNQLEEVKKIKKELAKLSLDFMNNVNNDNSVITVKADALTGLNDDLIASLRQNEQGDYIVGTDVPTYVAVMQNCSVESTRHDLWQAYNNRAHPVNDVILKKVIKLRDQLAKKLGFVSYAHLGIDDEMAKTPERVRDFLEDLLLRSEPKLNQEFAIYKQNLPENVHLTEDSKIKPWDLAYIEHQYKKKHLQLDEEIIQEYFPMQKAIDEMLDIYSQFLGVTFKEESLDGLWHKDVRYVTVYAKDGGFLGHLLLDLHPRDNKYGHACAATKVSAVRTRDGDYYPSVVIVIANFPKATAERPSLLKHNDVETLFHEFGHAVHMLLGATQMAGFSGTSVKLDFVEVPSQMFEEWMYDTAMLKKMSSHYKTGEQLPNELIKKIQEKKRFGKGYFVQRQARLALLALDLYAAGEDKDPSAISKKLFEQMSADLLYDDNNKFTSSFIHLIGYGAGYYCYLWSKVYALDLFKHIEKYGLLNNEIGKKYATEVIGKGGSIDPANLIKNFLGRESNSDAFFKDLGL